MKKLSLAIELENINAHIYLQINGIERETKRNNSRYKDINRDTKVTLQSIFIQIHFHLTK